MTRRGGRRRTDWSRAKHPMPASFADASARVETVQGRRGDDGLALVQALGAGAALAAVAELATGEADAPVREDAVALDADIVAAGEIEIGSEAGPELDEEED